MLFAIGATIGLTGFFGIIVVLGVIVFFVGRFIWDLIWLAWYHAWYVPMAKRREPKRFQQRVELLRGMSEEKRQRFLDIMNVEERTRIIQALNEIEKRQTLEK